MRKPKRESPSCSETQGATFTPEEIAALKNFHQQAHNLWNNMGRIQCVLRANIETLGQDNEPSERLDLDWLCSLNQAVIAILELCLESMQRRGDGIDHAHLDLPPRVSDILCQGFATVETERRTTK